MPKLMLFIVRYPDRIYGWRTFSTKASNSVAAVQALGSYLGHQPVTASAFLVDPSFHLMAGLE